MASAANSAAIGTLVRHERLKKGVRQSTLAKRSGVDQGNISRIERCIIAEPTDDTLRKLARGLRLDGDFFVTRHRRVFPAPPPAIHISRETFDVGFGFCIWASPIVALLGSVPAGIRITGCERGAGESRREWIEGHTYTRWWEAQPGNEDKRNRWSNVRFYTAPDLLPLLKQGHFDCIAVARGAYESDPAFITCADILVSRRDPEIMLFLNDAQLRTAGASELSFAEAWAAFAEISHAPIFYGGEEDAEGIVRQITSVLPANEVRRLHDVPLAPFADLLESHIEPLIRNRESFAFVGWHPYVAWLVECAGRGPGKYVFKRGASAAFPAYEEEVYSSVDLVLARDRLRYLLADNRLEQLLDAIEKSASQLRRIGGPPYALVRKASEYYQIPYDECDRELRRLKFELKIDPWWYREAHRAAHDHAIPFS
jgi:hypothetical protein